jgi:hypothetical protein
MKESTILLLPCDYSPSAVRTVYHPSWSAGMDPFGFDVGEEVRVRKSPLGSATKNFLPLNETSRLHDKVHDTKQLPQFATRVWREQPSTPILT